MKSEQVPSPSSLEFRVKSLDEIRKEKRKNEGISAFVGCINL